MVDDTDIPEVEHEHEHRDDKGFRRFSAIYVGVVAMLLAISALGGGKATKEMIAASIRVSDTYSFAQAEISARDVAYEVLRRPDRALQLNSGADRRDTGCGQGQVPLTRVERQMPQCRPRALRKRSCRPAKGRKAELLLAKAKGLGEPRATMPPRRRIPIFSSPPRLFQIAIVLGSVVDRRHHRARLLAVSAALAAVAVVADHERLLTRRASAAGGIVRWLSHWRLPSLPLGQA